MTIVALRKEAADRYACVTLHPEKGWQADALIRELRKSTANIVAIRGSNSDLSPILNESAVDELIHTAKKVYM